MTVHFIGAGPGAPDLLTIRGRDLIAASPICLYAGALVPREILEHAEPDAECIDTAELTLDEIVAVCVKAHANGQDVARLHSGDLAMWSAMAEQLRRLDALKIPYDITPGVPAFAAAAAALGREITLPAVAQTLILTRTAQRSTPMPPGEELANLAKTKATLALHLSIGRLSDVVAELLPHYGPEAAVIVVARASWPDECIIKGNLQSIVRLVAEAEILRNALIFVGPAFTMAEPTESYLYSAARQRT